MAFSTSMLFGNEAMGATEDDLRVLAAAVADGSDEHGVVPFFPGNISDLCGDRRHAAQRRASCSSSGGAPHAVVSASWRGLLHLRALGVAMATICAPFFMSAMAVGCVADIYSLISSAAVNNSTVDLHHLDSSFDAAVTDSAIILTATTTPASVSTPFQTPIFPATVIFHGAHFLCRVDVLCMQSLFLCGREMDYVALVAPFNQRGRQDILVLSILVLCAYLLGLSLVLWRPRVTHAAPTFLFIFISTHCQAAKYPPASRSLQFLRHRFGSEPPTGSGTGNLLPTSDFLNSTFGSLVMLLDDATLNHLKPTLGEALPLQRRHASVTPLQPSAGNLLSFDDSRTEFYLDVKGSLFRGLLVSLLL